MTLFDFFFLQRVSEPVNGYIQPVGGLDNCADSGRTAADLTRPNDRDHVLMVLLWCQSSKWLVVWGHVQQLFVIWVFFV